MEKYKNEIEDAAHEYSANTSNIKEWNNDEKVYSREEVENLLLRFGSHVYSNYTKNENAEQFLNNWINKHL